MGLACSFDHLRGQLTQQTRQTGHNLLSAGARNLPPPMSHTPTVRGVGSFQQGLSAAGRALGF